MIDLLETVAASAADREAVVTENETVTYASLVEQSRRVGAALRARGIDRFATLEADGAWVVRLLAGAAMAGAEMCQYQADIEVSEVSALVTELGHEVVITRRTDLPGHLQVVDPTDLLAAEPMTGASPDVQPVVVLTTGTTGLPKPVRHDWKQLIAAKGSPRPLPDQRWYLAYGPQQFGGIQVIVHALATQGTLVAPLPRRPQGALQHLVEHGVTSVSATPTFWRFVLAEARSLGIAPPPLKQVTLGGEATTSDLLDGVKAAFPEARISQIYGATEVGTLIAVNDGLPGISTESLYSADNPSSRMKVVDGEMWVRATVEAIDAAGGEAPPAEHWRPTGDLVEIVGDRVEFRGRSSDIVNVGGVKVHPMPIEAKVLAVDGVSLARAFGRPNALTGAVVAVEVVPDSTVGADAEARENLIRRVRSAVADLPRAARPRSITVVDDIAMRGGKTLRRTT